MQHFMEEMNIRWWIISFLFLNQDKILRIQLQQVQRDANNNNYYKVWNDANSFFSDIFIAVVIVVA